MPIKEESFRIGCGRYIQGPGYIDKTGDEILRLGTSPLMIGGKTALHLVKEQILKSIAGKCNNYEFVVHTGTCNEARAKELTLLAREKGYDVIVGIGGGVICDFAKLCGHFSGLPVINIPTSSATCAAYTPLSVTYTKDFRRAGSFHHDREVNAVLADMDLICTQPERLLAAGVYDAAAKLIEIEQRVRDIPVDEVDVGLNASYALSRHTYERMFALMPAAVEALNRKDGESKALSDLVYLAMAATGVISGMARGSNQCAIAHKIYDLARALFPAPIKDALHGEIVAIGLLAQLYYNGRENEVEAFAADMRSHGLPTSLHEIGIEPSAENMKLLYDKMVDSTAMAGTDAEEQARLLAALEIIK